MASRTATFWTRAEAQRRWTATVHRKSFAGFEVQVTADEFLGHGPLAGIHAGLGLVRCPYAFVVACDMPFLRPEPVAFLVNQIAGQDAVVPAWDGDIEPLHAVYRTPCGRASATRLRGGVRAIRDFLPAIQVRYIPEGGYAAGARGRRIVSQHQHTGGSGAVRGGCPIMTEAPQRAFDLRRTAQYSAF